MRSVVTLLLLLCTAAMLHAQTINGIVVDAGNGAIGDATVHNVYTDAVFITGVDGRFSMAAAAGQLIEFRKMGYKTGRLRITAITAPFYKIGLDAGVQELDEVEVRNHHTDFKHDSLRYHELFKKQLEYPVLTGWRAFQSPFSAMGKTNQQMIHFQKEYAWFEEQKYVDYTFNEKLVANLTGLKGDSAVQYMRRFRPSYEMLRAMPEYDYFTYVKRTVMLWRRRQQGLDNSRGGG